VTEWVPTVSVETVSCALLLARVAVPSELVPSTKVIVPVAVEPAGGCTVAVRATACPNVAGFVFATITVDVATGFTVSTSAVDVLPAKFESPLYCALMDREPAAKEETASCAVPFESETVPRVVVPFRKVTEPVGPVPELARTVAEKVTSWP
jgi:hypothetical protein